MWFSLCLRNNCVLNNISWGDYKREGYILYLTWKSDMCTHRTCKMLALRRSMRFRGGISVADHELHSVPFIWGSIAEKRHGKSNTLINWKGSNCNPFHNMKDVSNRPINNILLNQEHGQNQHHEIIITRGYRRLTFCNVIYFQSDAFFWFFEVNVLNLNMAVNGSEDNQIILRSAD